MFYVYTTVSLTLILESCLILSYMFDQHISNIVSKTYSMLGLMQRNFRELSRECFVCKETFENYLENALLFGIKVG